MDTFTLVVRACAVVILILCAYLAYSVLREEVRRRLWFRAWERELRVVEPDEVYDWSRDGI